MGLFVNGSKQGTTLRWGLWIPAFAGMTYRSLTNRASADPGLPNPYTV